MKMGITKEGLMKKNTNPDVLKKVESIKRYTERKTTEKELNRLANLEIIKEIIEESIPVFKGNTKKFTYKTNLKKKLKTLCVIISDVHIGKKTYEFDYEIFLSKLNELYNQIVNEIQCKQIDELVLFFNGDLVDGNQVYKGHHNYICMPTGKQALEGAKEFSDFILNLSNFVPVRVECIGGNHGRRGDKGEHTYDDNFDNIMCEVMKVHLKDVSNVTVNVYYDWKAFVKVQDLTVLAFHGDNTKVGNPLSGLPKAITNWADMWRHEQSFDVSVTGHYHLPVLSVDVNGREMFINGSFVPSDEFTEQVVKAKSKTGQVSFIVSGNKISDRNLLEV
jgi:predicted phosphodiesterase